MHVHRSASSTLWDYRFSEQWLAFSLLHSPCWMVPLSIIMNGRRLPVQQPRPLERSDNILLCVGHRTDNVHALCICLADKLHCQGSFWATTRFTFCLDDQDVHQLCVNVYFCSLLMYCSIIALAARHALLMGTVSRKACKLHWSWSRMPHGKCGRLNCLRNNVSEAMHATSMLPVGRKK